MAKTPSRRAYNKTWRANNKDKCAAYQRTKRHKDPLRFLVRDARARAKERGIEFSITKHDLVIPDVCPVLGIPIHLGKGYACPNSPSLDRIDPMKGYVKGNVQVISWRANRLKSDASLDEILKLAAYMETISGGH